MKMRFNKLCGQSITLLDNDLIAVRSTKEFRNGVVLSSEPLTDDVMFEVQIKAKVLTWHGGIKIGITTINPAEDEIPATSLKLRDTAWLMSGSAVLKDCVKIKDNYGPELDRLRIDDTVGVMRTSQGDLMFYVNGRCLGIADNNIPPRVYAIVDMYGQCYRIRLVNPPLTQPARIIMTHSNMVNNGENSLTSSSSRESIPDISILFLANGRDQTPIPIMTENDQSFSLLIDEEDERPSSYCISSSTPEDCLLFHPRCGTFVRIFQDQRSAERIRPHDEYNNGVILTHRPLYDNELFEICIEKIIDKWSGSVEVGITTHDPETIHFPSTMTNMDSGTIMLSGSKILVNGCGTSTDYSQFNLDELKEGDRIGIMRRVDGKLHFYINGVDQGLAAENLEPLVWGVVDLYGMTVKVSIVDDADDNNCSMPDLSINNDISHLLWPRRGDPSLTFHSLRNSDAIAINDDKTAYRPNAFEKYSNGIIMTNRTLKTDELFQVRIDVIIPKWEGGGIEIGVTELSCNEIHYPYNISSLKVSTWSIAGTDFIKDGVIVISNYLQPLERLVEGDMVGVMRKDMGILHFFVNGVDQGPAAFNVPERVFGIVDLVGRVGQVSMAEPILPRLASPESPGSDTVNDMHFHTVCSPNGKLSGDLMTASRVSKYQYAVFFSSRPLRECEMFELRIDKIFKSYDSLGFGVTAAKPTEIDVGSVKLATVLPANTYVLSGDCLMKSIPPHGKYNFNLNVISVGTRVGLMWHADRNIHFYIDGQDQGAAFFVTSLDIYVVVDLYGGCTQVTLLPSEEHDSNIDTNMIVNMNVPLISIPWHLISFPRQYCFSEYCGDNVVLSENFSVARRRWNLESECTLVFSAAQLTVGKIFEVKLLEFASPCGGSFRMGITDVNILNAHVNRYLPRRISMLTHFTAYIDGHYIKYSSPSPDSPENISIFVPSFDWLRVNDKVGFKKAADGNVYIFINAEYTGYWFSNVPDRVYVVMELYGQVTAIEALCKMGCDDLYRVLPAPCEIMEQYANVESLPPSPDICDLDQMFNRFRCPGAFSFMQQHGLNIKLCSSDTVAIRSDGYSDGLVLAKQRLKRGRTFMFRIDKMDDSWSGTLAVGGLGSIRNLKFPVTAFDIKAHCWIISEDGKNINGNIYLTDDGKDLQHIHEQSNLSLQFHYDGSLYVVLDEKYRILIAKVPKNYKAIYPIIDIYGQIHQISIIFHKMSLTGSHNICQPKILEFIEEKDDAEENVLIRTSFSEDDLLVRASIMNTPWTFIPPVAEVPKEAQEEEEDDDNDDDDDGGDDDEDGEEEVMHDDVSRQYDSNIMASNTKDNSNEEISPINQAAYDETVYLCRLLKSVNPENELYDTLENSWMVAAKKCIYVQKVYMYWKHLTEIYKHLGVALSSGKVQCYCRECKPEALQYQNGWVRIEAVKDHEKNMNSRQGIFWHPKAEVYEGRVEFTDRSTIIAVRPAVFNTIPKIIPEKKSTIWCTEGGRRLDVSVSVEVNLGGIRDRLSSILVNIHEETDNSPIT